MIKGLNHVTVAVKDLERSFSFYRDVMGFKPLCRWATGAYLLAGDMWFSLNVDAKCAPTPDYTHVAFDVSDKHFEEIQKRIVASGALIFQSNFSPGHSLYFLDPDGHKFELHVGTWQDRLAIMKKDKKDTEFFV